MKPWMKNAALVLAGLLLGSAATAWGLHFSFMRMRTNMSKPDYLLGRLDCKLKLTTDQKDKVAALIKEDLPKMNALHEESAAKSKALWDSFDAGVRPILNPDQLKKLDKMETEWREHKGPKIGFGGYPVDQGLMMTPTAKK